VFNTGHIQRSGGGNLPSHDAVAEFLGGGTEHALAFAAIKDGKMAE
jgi:hypothetical protein